MYMYPSSAFFGESKLIREFIACKEGRPGNEATTSIGPRYLHRGAGTGT